MAFEWKKKEDKTADVASEWAQSVQSLGAVTAELNLALHGIACKLRSGIKTVTEIKNWDVLWIEAHPFS